MKTCQKCGHADLHWSQLDGKWRLLTQGGQLHICRTPKVAKAPRFTGLHRAFTEGAFKLKPAEPKYPPCPPEAEWNFIHPWWSWLDGEPPQHMRKKKGPEQTVFEGLVP